MGLILAIKNMFSAKRSSASNPPADIGNAEPICPYCDAVLDKMPGRKKKCLSCGKFIYIRTRPSDKKKILIKEDQISMVEEQWAIANGTHEQFLAEREAYEKGSSTFHVDFSIEPAGLAIM